MRQKEVKSSPVIKIFIKTKRKITEREEDKIISVWWIEILRMYSSFGFVVQILFWSGSFVGLCVCNYRISKWIFLSCSSSIWYFVPTYVVVFATMAWSVYVLTRYFTRVYLRRLMRSLDQTDLVEFSLLMSKFKENQCSKLLMTNNHYAQHNECLVCYDYAAKTITNPCGHQVMCGSCAWKYIATSIRDCSPLRCILCRTEVAEYKGDITVVLDKFNMGQIASIAKSKALAAKNTNNMSLEPCSM